MHRHFGSNDSTAQRLPNRLVPKANTQHRYLIVKPPNQLEAIACLVGTLWTGRNHNRFVSSERWIVQVQLVIAHHDNLLAQAN
jgi:hypothetical protein